MINRPELPYPGLRAFSADENILFFGREGCVDQMLETLAATRFLAVLGSSGSGKSSLVRTGLLNAIERGAILDAGSDWLVADFHPASDPIRALAIALVPDADTDQIDALESFLSAWPGALVEWAQYGNLPLGRSLLLLVDQFEELFRYGDYVDQQAAEAFVALLLHSAASQDMQIYVVLTMRSEYLGNCALVPGLAERINQGLYLTPRMDRQSCREAIEGPANVFGFSIEPKLVNQILNDMASFAPFERGGSGGGPTQLSRRADQLPLMQHLLNRLWTRAEASGEKTVTLQFADYLAVGGLEGALESHGQAIIDSLPAQDREIVQTIFRALVSGRDAASAVRRAVPFATLEAEAGPSSRAVVNAFRARDCNFLRPESHVPLGPETLVDISHESLIRQWGLLANWTRAEADDGATWQRLIGSEARWRADEGGLLTGRDLGSLSQWWESDPPTASWAERHGGNFAAAASYLSESQVAEAKARDAEVRRDLRDRRRLITASAVLAVTTIISIVFWSRMYAKGVTLESTQAKIVEANYKFEQAEIKRKSAELQLATANSAMQQRESESENRIRRANAELEVSKIEIEKSKDLVEKIEEILKQRQAEIAAADKRVADAEKILQRQAADGARSKGELFKALEYCNQKEQENDTTCKILRGRNVNSVR
jgi:ABC-type oligopeptide transport system ATPase subunit